VESKRRSTMPAYVVGLVNLCCAAALVILGIKVLGLELPSGWGVKLPDMGETVLYLVLLFAVGVFSIIFAFWFAGEIKPWLFGLFDDRWLPREGKETYTTTYGERLKKVAPQSYMGVVVWKMAAVTIPTTFFVSLIVGVLALATSLILGKPQLILSLFLVAAVNTIAISWSYSVEKWKAANYRAVIFTTCIKYATVETNFFEFLSGSGDLPSVSTTLMSEIRDKQASADPEKFDKSIKTSWLRDRYTAYLSRKKDIRTLFLRSKYNEAQDTVTWIDHGTGLFKLLESLSREAAQLEEEQRFIDQEVIQLKMGRADDDNYSRKRSEEEARLYTNRFSQLSEPPKTYDLFRVKDPGLYDDEGNLIEKPSSEIVTEPGEIDDADTDVSHYFSPSRGK